MTFIRFSDEFFALLTVVGALGLVGWRLSGVRALSFVALLVAVSLGVAVRVLIVSGWSERMGL